MPAHPPARVLTARDRAVLELIGGPGLASVTQVRAYGWPACVPQTALNRLLKLERAGYVRLLYTDARGRPERVAVLTAQGRAAFPPAVRERLHTGLPPRAEQTQALLVQDGRLWLERELAAHGNRLLTWHNEHELRANRPQRAEAPAPLRHYADARALVLVGGQEVEITIEADGCYFGAMLAAKMHYLGRLGGRVLYVCPPRRVPAVRAAAAAYPNIEILPLGGPQG